MQSWSLSTRHLPIDLRPMEYDVSVPLRSKTSPQCTSSVISMPAIFATTCAPESCWNFSAASARSMRLRANGTTIVARRAFVVRTIRPPSKRASTGWCVTARSASQTPSALCARGLIKSCAQALSELERIVVRPEMHENQPGLLSQHVTVDCRHLDAVLSESLDNRIHFVSYQYEVTGNGGLAAAGRLEVNRRRYSHRAGRSNLHSVLGYRIAPRHPKLINASVSLPLGADDLIELR